MKYKKSMIILIIAIFLLSIASVCASAVDEEASSDVENTVIELSDENLNTNEDNEQSIDETTEETLSASVDDEILTSENDLEELKSKTTTYSELTDELSVGGNLQLNYDYYTYDHENTIGISDDDITIDGNGAVIDMAGSSIRALSVIGSRLTIKNLTIKNANYEGNGSAIYFEDDGIIKDCEFINNNAHYGSVYFNKNGKIENCNFNGNNASSGAGAFIWGEGKVKNCTVYNNYATDGGEWSL